MKLDGTLQEAILAALASFTDEKLLSRDKFKSNSPEP
jgi:type I restriction enzyme M protein